MDVIGGGQTYLTCKRCGDTWPAGMQFVHVCANPEPCPRCYALVLKGQMDDHIAWHTAAVGEG